ncbi:DegT/DnrJ/EryC1/StrS family aminotransferase [Amphibacillus sediminis]|uniref:DegT/DnrJ/EryC1/StrS family aminotransferase n=1 Tax=Amphibacillus sediminis TaxID=360185 RepID=UPI000836ECCF|nr:DegT/DnrJ/EryC1/StrS family aminotransferase [Amphibacillus sediminis]
MIPLLDLKKQYLSIESEITDALKHVLRSGQYILGPTVSQLENQFAAQLGVKEAVGVANGTDALILTLKAYNIGEGDEVITTPFTFIATAEAISRVGAKPVFADVDLATGLIDPDQIEAKITTRTRAIIPVHIFGQTADMDKINTLAQQHQLVVIEDACQAFGAKYKGKPAGSLGDAACFSFFPTKNLGGLGDGGIVATNDDTIAAKIRQLRVHGSSQKYFHDQIGYNSRLDAIQAAILLICLEHVDDWNTKRRKIAKKYNDELEALVKVTTLKEVRDNEAVYHLFCLKSVEREKIMRALKMKDIGTAIYYPCCLHLQKVYHSLNYKHGDFPNAEQLSETIFSIPMHPFLTTEEQQSVIDCIKEVART